MEAPCPRLKKEWDQAELDIRLPMNETMQHVYKKLKKFSGHKISSLMDVAYLVDVLKIEVTKSFPHLKTFFLISITLHRLITSSGGKGA